MKLSLSGTCNNAANALEKMAVILRENEDWHPESDEDDPADGIEAEVFCLKEVMRFCHLLKTGKGTLAEFCEVLCLEYPAESK